MRGIYFFILFIISLVLFYMGSPATFGEFMRKLFNIVFPLIVCGGVLIFYLNKYSKKNNNNKKGK